MGQSVLAKMAVQIAANTAGFNAAMQDAAKSVRGVGTTIDGIADKVKNFALGYVGFQQALNIGSQVIKSLSDFEAEMSKVRAVTNETKGGIDVLRRSAIDLGASFGASSKDVASLQLEFARLGFSTGEILKSSKAAILLAKATGEDLAMSAQIAGSTLRSFNLDASEMNRVTDVMAAAFNKSALGLSDFGEAIKYVAPVAAAAGLSLEQVSAMLGVLADNGIKGSMAGTSLRKIISDLGEGSAPKLTKALGEMAAKGLDGAAAMDEVGRTAYASLLILAKNTEGIDKATVAYKNANGELEKMAKIMQDNLAGDWDKLSGSMDKAIQGDGDRTNILRGIVQQLTMLSNYFQRDDISGWEKAWAAAFTTMTHGTEVIQLQTLALDRLTKNQESLNKAIDATKTSENWWTDFSELTPDAEEDMIAKARLIAENAEAAKKYAEELKEAVKWVNQLFPKDKEFQKVGSVGLAQHTSALSVDKLPGQMGGVDLNLGGKAATEAYNANADELIAINERLQHSFKTMAADVISSLAESIGGGEPIGQALLKSLANFGKQYGRQLVALGVGKVAEGIIFKNPVAVKGGLQAIAAGAALGIVSSAVGKSVSGGGDVGGQNINQNATRGGVSGNSQSEQRLVIRVEAKGSDLVGVYDSAKADNKIRRGG